MELPDDDGDLEVLSGDRRRQHRRDQAQRHHAGDDGDARRARGQALPAWRAECRLRRPEYRCRGRRASRHRRWCRSPARWPRAARWRSARAGI